MTRKAESLDDGCGIQVVVPNPDHTFTLDEEALTELLLQEDVKDRAVVVLSVAGAFRKGKSFLLDFFLRYMHHKYVNGNNGDNWLGEKDEPLKGFKWRGGSERATTGLLLWSQPFKATLPSGEKVVVLLVDTQGTFDSESTVRDNATVFALSTLISSVQIYNLSQNIEEDELQHLQLFTDYGQLVQDKSEGRPFQKLLFLIRDWSYPYDQPYGAEGGRQLLEKRLKIREGQHKELQTLREYIRKVFDEISCFLMPHPGMKVATSSHFDGNVEDIDTEFKEQLKVLVPMLLAPENLVPKLIAGQKVKAKEMLHYFKVYMKVFNGAELPEPKSILAATSEANNLSAVAEAKEIYENMMDEIVGGTRPYMLLQTLEEEHKRIKNKALHAFESKKKMGGQELANSYREGLEKDLEELFEQLKAHNEGKNIYRMITTPVVFLSVAVLGYVVSMLGGVLGVKTIAAIGELIAIISFVLCLVWGYTRATGSLREVGMQLDEAAGSIQNYVLSKGFNTMKSRSLASVMNDHVKKNP